MANAAFYFGLVRALAESERPLWSQMSFSAAEENFHVAAQHGIDAQVYWPGVGQVRATELVLRRLLPLAHEGLDAWGRRADERDRLLGIIEQRCLTGTNGAEWFVAPDAHQRATWTGYDALRRDPAGVPRAACTPTSRCTPGSDSVGQRCAQPLPHPAYVAARVPPALPGDHHHRQRHAGLGVRRARGGSQSASDVVEAEHAGPGQPDQRRSLRPAAGPAQQGRRPRRRAAPWSMAARRRATA